MNLKYLLGTRSITVIFVSVIMPIFLSETARGEPIANLIQWEIQNRFSPFEALNDPAATFEKYQISPEDGGFEAWHRRLSSMHRGFESPYAANLKRGKPIHWIPSQSEHTSKVLAYVKAEDDPNLKLQVSLWSDTDAPCQWSFETQPRTSCRERATWKIPFSGTTVQLQINGKQISQHLKPTHRVILGLGDSYGAGEGNPDVPVRWKRKSPPTNLDFTWLQDTNYYEPMPKYRWVDGRCHRSFFSFQSLTALRYASDNPHVFVSFLHYSCTGAEIFDGLLVPQYQAWNTSDYVPYSQLNQALRELCSEPISDYGAVTREELGKAVLSRFDRRGGYDPRKKRGNTPTTASDLRPNDNFDDSTKEIARRNSYLFPRSGLMKCPSESLRRPDMILLSVGGNDIGFADIVKYYLAPARAKLSAIRKKLYPEVCPASNNRVIRKSNKRLAKHCDTLDAEICYDSGLLISGGKRNRCNRKAGETHGIDRKFALLFNIIKQRLNVRSRQIVMAQYPDPLRTRPPISKACDKLSGDDLVNVHGSSAGRFNLLSPWNGLKTAIPDPDNPLITTGLKLGLGKRWQFNLTGGSGGEAFVLLRQFSDFRAVLSATAKLNDISFTCRTRDAFVGYGWWEGKFQSLPNFADKSGNRHWNPSEWDPYAFESRTRAVRTGNDSAMTQPHQNYPESSIMGTVHPNLTGSRLIAEILYNDTVKNFWR